jgi:hypothetical protein
MPAFKLLQRSANASAYHVVRLADELFPAEARKLDKEIVGDGDPASHVSATEDELAVGHPGFDIGTGLVDAHHVLLFGVT